MGLDGQVGRGDGYAGGEGEGGDAQIVPVQVLKCISVNEHRQSGGDVSVSEWAGYSIISKMIINKELTASLDEPTQTVIMHRTEPTKLQTLTLQLSEKITTLMDQTERMIKGGEMSAFFQRNPGQQSQQGQNREHNN